MIQRRAKTIARSVDVNRPYLIEIRLPAWYDDAVCSQTDPESFYPYMGVKGVNHIQTAKRVCSGCPVRLQCLQHALDEDEQYGIWGGMTRYERKRLAGKSVA